MKTPDRATLDLIRRDADRGVAQAQMTLAYIFLKGKGLTRDRQKAFEWYEKAAKQGNLIAQVKLGGLYRAKDLAMAFAWHSIAMDNGYRVWHHRLACFLLEHSLSKQELLEAHNFLRDWRSQGITAFQED